MMYESGEKKFHLLLKLSDIKLFSFSLIFTGSHSTMLGLVNLFVHTVMYSYYFVTSLNKIKETLWWKRHITQLQLLQFGYLALHFLQVVVNNTCGHPNLVSFVGFIQNLFMFAMFSEFYYRTYMKKPAKTNNQLQDQCAIKQELKSN